MFQLLWYPSTLWDQSLPSLAENADAPILDVKAIAAFSRWYAGEIDLHNPPAPMAPGRAENLADLPPAYIAVAGYDPLRDDGIRYGELLAAAGVPVEVHNAQTLVHGYVAMPVWCPPPPRPPTVGWWRYGLCYTDRPGGRTVGP